MGEPQTAPDRLDLQGNPISAAPDRLDAQGNPVAPPLTGGQHLAVGPQTFNDTPLPPDWKTRLGAVMESAAHPKTMGDVVSLLFTAGAMNPQMGEAASLAGKALTALPVRTIANKTLTLGGDLLDNPIAHWMSYRAPLVGRALKATADAIGETEAAAAPVVRTAAPVAGPAMTAPPVVPTAPPVDIDSAIAAAKSAVGPSIPKPHLTAQDVMQIQSLIDRGVSQADAIAAVAKIRALGGKSFPISSVLPK